MTSVEPPGPQARPFVLSGLGHGDVGEDTEVYATPKFSHRIYAKHDASASADRTHTRGSSFGDILRVSRLTAASYSVGHFLNDACASLWFSYLLFYLERAQKLSPLDSGAVLFSGQLFDALATPTVGLLSDRSRGIPSLGLGRRKLWNLIGVCIVIVCFFFVFGTCLPCDVRGGEAAVSAAAKTVNFAVFASLFNVGWAAVQVSHMCMVPELTHDEGERVMLNSARYAFTILANVLVFVSMALVLHFYDGGAKTNDSNPESYALVTYVVLVVGGILSAVFLVGTKEQLVLPAPQAVGGAGEVAEKAGAAGRAGRASDSTPLLLYDEAEVGGGGLQIGASAPSASSINAPPHAGGEDDADGDGGESPVPERAAAGAIVPSGAPGSQAHEMHISSFRRKAHMAWRDWLRVPEFYKVAGVYMCTRLATNVSQVYISFYVTTTLNMSPTAIALVPLLLYLAQLGATGAMKRVAALLGRHFSFLAGAVLFGAACVAMLLTPASASWAVYPTMLALGAGSAVVTVISVSMEADLVGRNVESGAFVYGAMSFTDKLSNGTFILLIQYAGEGLDDKGAMSAMSRYVRGVNALIPLAAIVLAAVIAFTIPFPARLQGSQSFKDLQARFSRRGAKQLLVQVQEEEEEGQPAAATAAASSQGAAAARRSSRAGAGSGSGPSPRLLLPPPGRVASQPAGARSSTSGGPQASTVSADAVAEAAAATGSSSLQEPLLLRGKEGGSLGARSHDPSSVAAVVDGVGR